MPSEAQARITINKMLEEAGWRFLPDAQGRRENIVCEHRVTRRAFSSWITRPMSALVNSASLAHRPAIHWPPFA